MQTEFSFDSGPILLIEKITLVGSLLINENIFRIIWPKKGIGYGFRMEILQCYGSLLYLSKEAKKGDDYKV